MSDFARAVDTIKALGADFLECPTDALAWSSWDQTFSSTAGPAGGIGGQTMTSYQAYGFEDQRTGTMVKFCGGVWKPWNGELRGKW